MQCCIFQLPIHEITLTKSLQAIHVSAVVRGLLLSQLDQKNRAVLNYITLSRPSICSILAHRWHDTKAGASIMFCTVRSVTWSQQVKQTRSQPHFIARQDQWLHLNIWAAKLQFTLEQPSCISLWTHNGCRAWIWMHQSNIPLQLYQVMFIWRLIDAARVEAQFSKGVKC